MKKDKKSNNNNGYFKYMCIALLILGVIMGLMASAGYTPGGLVVVLIAAPLMACAYFISKAKEQQQANQKEENKESEDNTENNDNQNI